MSMPDLTRVHIILWKTLFVFCILSTGLGPYGYQMGDMKCYILLESLSYWLSENLCWRVWKFHWWKLLHSFVEPLFSLGWYFRKIKYYYCAISLLMHEIQISFDTLSISMYSGTPLKKIKGIFVVVVCRRYIIFGHFLSFLLIFWLVRGFSYLLYLVIGCNSWKIYF